MDRVIRGLATALLFVIVCAGPSPADDWRPGKTRYLYHVPPDGAPADKQARTIIGRPTKHQVREGESLLDISRHYHLGYGELVQANQGVDSWVPAVGKQINIPSVWVLPNNHYRGIVLNIPEMRLYFYLSDSQVMTFPLGIGMEGWDTPPGKYRIGEKRVNPVWYVPRSIQKEMEVPRKMVPPGPDNPLGSYWMRLSSTAYGIHGTNNPWAVGRYVTHGCIRLYPEDIAYLFPRVRPGTPVEVIYQYAKVGLRDGKAYFQIHRYRGRTDSDLFMELVRQFRSLGLAVDLRRTRELLRTAKDGALIPLPLSH